jgi:hypothetical protein
MAGDEIEMSPTSIMMIHNPWGYWQGESKDFRHAAEVLDEVKETIVNAYQLKSRKSRKKISEMMDNETWMSAKTALNEGFIDGILYSESQSQEPVENSFMFSRMAIQNSATDSIKKFIEQYNERLKQNQKLNKTEEPPKPEAFLMPENMTPKNLAAAFRSANRSGEQTDDPEGSMYIAISDTLANQIADYLESLPEPKEEPRQVPVDLYTKLYENLERRAKL